MPVFSRFRTGDVNPESGLFICTGCGEIIPLSKGERFPPCASCKEGTDWQLIVSA